MSSSSSSPAPRPRLGSRLPSGPRPISSSRPGVRPTSSGTSSSRVTSYSSFSSNEPLLNDRDVATPLRRPPPVAELDVLLDGDQGLTVSPDESPGVQAHPRASGPRPLSPTQTIVPTRALRTYRHDSARDSTEASIRAVSPSVRSPPPRPTSPAHSSGARSASPALLSGTRIKPHPLKLNTANLASVVPGKESPTKMLSPTLKHWQQIRSAVMASSPLVDDRRSSTASGQSGKNKRPNFVAKAAGRFGFRNAADSAMGYHDRRRSSMGFMASIGGFDPEQRQEIIRERQRFARDLKTCLDACAAEETRRRLARIGQVRHHNPRDSKSGGSTVYPSSYTFDPDFSAYAPLLMELHKYLPAVRAKKVWSRTCPHHSAILAELGVAFLADGTTSIGEQQQALEVFITLVRNWAPDSPEEELQRWLWLCRAMMTDDRQIRKRGLSLLEAFLHHDPDLPSGHAPPAGAFGLVLLMSAVLRLLCAVRVSPDAAFERSIQDLLHDCVEGDVMEIDNETVAELLGMMKLDGSLGGVQRELLWLAVARLLQQDRRAAQWLLLADEQHLLVGVSPNTRPDCADVCSSTHIARDSSSDPPYSQSWNPFIPLRSHKPRTRDP